MLRIWYTTEILPVLLKSPRAASHRLLPQAFDTTNEKARFILEDGVWLFADYQRFQFNTSALFKNVEQVAVPEGKAEGKAQAA